jgi:archaellum component FlaC
MDNNNTNNMDNIDNNIKLIFDKLNMLENKINDVNTKLEFLNTKLLFHKLDMLGDQMNNVNAKLDFLSTKMSDCESSCKNMDDHINFVEETYQTLRSPLDFVKSQVNYITGNTTNSGSLPQLKDKKTN